MKLWGRKMCVLDAVKCGQCYDNYDLHAEFYSWTYILTVPCEDQHRSSRADLGHGSKSVKVLEWREKRKGARTSGVRTNVSNKEHCGHF